jgi:hypothetical protein
MRNSLSKLEPEDLIAALIIMGCLALMAIGKDGTFRAVLTTITGYYFGKKTAQSSRRKYPKI